MAEYTIKDVIIDPQDPRLEGAIGKKVYYGITPYSVLSHAKGINKDIAGTYRGISHTDIVDYFLIEESQTSYDCIILKKEEPKPKYVPFESAEEFVKEYRKHIRATDDSIEDTLHCCGMWIRNKHSKKLCQVVFIVETGVRIGGQNYGIDWNIMLKDFKFLDGSPCGKEVK